MDDKRTAISAMGTLDFLSSNQRTPCFNKWLLKGVIYGKRFYVYNGSLKDVGRTYMTT
jgi:hypothetical protein